MEGREESTGKQAGSWTENKDALSREKNTEILDFYTQWKMQSSSSSFISKVNGSITK
jgi:hypothetical protein